MVRAKNNEDKFEEFKLNGYELVNKIKELIKAGNIRRIIIKNEKGKVMMEIPVTVAVIGAVFAPVLAAIGALAALLNKCSLVVEKK
ncbi:MAG: DUF4342 domain-containing protein [Patescibacteria group bacterium]|nr:DUF4342 domain-containing protein [Patescibacteria group bacterium]